MAPADGAGAELFDEDSPAIDTASTPNAQQPSAKATSWRNFDWDSDESVVCRTQLGVAAYINARGDICIRQQADYCDDEDTFITVGRHCVRDLILALNTLADEIGA